MDIPLPQSGCFFLETIRTSLDTLVLEFFIADFPGNTWPKLSFCNAIICNDFFWFTNEVNRLCMKHTVCGDKRQWNERHMESCRNSVDGKQEKLIAMKDTWPEINYNVHFKLERHISPEISHFRNRQYNCAGHEQPRQKS